MMKERTERTYEQRLTFRNDEEGKGVIEGVPIVFDAETVIAGTFRERIDPDAVSEASMKDVRLMVNHNLNELPLARSRNNNENSTMHLWKEADGVHMRAKLDTDNNPRAKELQSAVARGDVDGMSFAFYVTGEKWSDLDAELPLRTITGIGNIIEVSAVIAPAYEQTSINARALESELASLDSAKQALESARKMEEMRKELLERSAKLCRKD